MRQTTFLDSPPTAHARRTDPQTSHDAAAELPRGEAEAIALQAARELSAKAGDFTANELGTHGACIEREDSGYFFSAETIRKRYTGLLNRGLITLSGRRVCGMTGKMAQTYRLTEKGRELVE